MADTHTIFFLGKPGCGKGTQARHLSRRTEWPIISAGAQFREIATENSPVGRKIKNEIDSGALAPHWFAMYLYQKSLFSVPENQSVIFDGFNRKLEEARLVVDSLTWLNRPFVVINLVISDELVRTRIETRSRSEKRGDDQSVETRLEEYYTYTQQAIELFRAEHMLVDIDGAQDEDTIAADICTALALSA
ncbi:MAG: hypothetical protein B7X04_02460 [Parcubacteria group bacterium 21-54-25]|nr:MAG: hypothetical protein B7X04_02460 [Parcubacteria group bacterium 21-54-25]HQU08249.1 nucleoside monophosphate kinase [Candidatus Paceibacterota bacterium]